jgi:NAD-dependent SIR2 family protein deacetylase
MADTAEYYCVQCDCTFEVWFSEATPDEPEVTHCPCCGEALDAEEL